MNKSNEQTTTELVYKILQNHPGARNSDNQLYYLVCSVVGKRNGVDIESMPMPRFFLHMKEFGMPNFETVRRTRQRIQAEHPELAGRGDCIGE